MGVILEIRDGPMAGKVIGLKTGESVTFGRAAGRAEFALAHDTFMSGVHFAVECGPSGCRVQDRKSSNGTFLNGARISDAMLANGDEIKGGQTIFAVKFVADAKLASLMPPQELAPLVPKQPRPSAAGPAPCSAPGQPPHASKPALSAPPESRPLAAEPAPPRVPPSAGLQEERKPAPPAQSPVAAGAPVGDPEPPSLAMRIADLDEVADSRQAQGVREPAVNKVLPPVEEPPKVRAIPGPPDAGVKSGRRAELPAGVAPYIAEKFADRPGSRVGDSLRGAAFSVMGWSFPAAPAEWQVQEGFGLQQSGHGDFPSSVAATEELLGGITLQQFVESQISMLRGYLRDPKIEPTMPPRVGGADESMAMDVRHSTKDGRELVYRRIYARSGSSVGVLTVTTLAADLPQVLQSLQPLLDGAAFRATVNK